MYQIFALNSVVVKTQKMFSFHEGFLVYVMEPYRGDNKCCCFFNYGQNSYFPVLSFFLTAIVAFMLP